MRFGLHLHMPPWCRVIVDNPSKNDGCRIAYTYYRVLMAISTSCSIGKDSQLTLLDPGDNETCRLCCLRSVISEPRHVVHFSRSLIGVISAILYLKQRIALAPLYFYCFAMIRDHIVSLRKGSTNPSKCYLNFHL